MSRIDADGKIMTLEARERVAPHANQRERKITKFCYSSKVVF